MTTLQHILDNVATIAIQGNANAPVQSLTIDSRKAGEGSVFIAIKGTHVDGHEYIAATIEQGCTIIVGEQVPDYLPAQVTFVQVADSSAVAGLLAHNFYGKPSEKLKLVGITGTNGKTTVATILHKLFSGLGYLCGLLSTVQNQIGDEVIPATHTTPDPITLHALLAQMADAGCMYAFMEVSSHAVHQHRIAGAVFAGGIFTNITHDHLDYHKTFDEYIRVKKSFFDHLPAGAFALTNLDDKRGMVMLQNTVAHKHGYSLRTLASFKGKILENNLTGLIMDVNGQEVHFRLIGMFNAYNLLAVYGAAVLLEQDKQQVLRVLSNLSGAEGRFDYTVSPHKGIIGIVDYAHTPDALLNVLATINHLRQGNEQVITVVGCGGDRDTAKRPVMAEVAAEHSDKVILTSDNPRSEDPAEIIKQMEAGLKVTQHKKTLSITDRKEAIKTACSLAQPGDIILIAGKGHEKYQEIKGVKHPFDDKAMLKDMFNLFDQ